MLDFKNVSYQYQCENFDIIDNLSFHIGQEQFVSLVGVSGCGKSTIFRLITGLLALKEGEIKVGGREISQLQNYVGYMPQRDLLFPWRSIRRNLQLPLEIKKTSQDEMTRRTEAILKEIGLSGCGEKYPNELSGGMRQRAAFGRTALTDSNLLLLDEPFSALDFLTRLAMQEWLLEQWQRHKKTVLFITHDIEEAIFLSGTVLVITETPIRYLEAIKIPLPYPRRREDLDSPEIIAIKARLLQLLRKQVQAL